MSESNRQIGLRIRTLRLARKWSQAILAERAGLSTKFIGEVERGQANSTVETLDAVAAALSVDLGDLVSDRSRAALAAIELVEVVRELRGQIDTAVERLTADDYKAPSNRRRHRPRS